ncbi:MAG: hypothetical protein R2939_18535 [Kofleriaceae bacterium]
MERVNAKLRWMWAVLLVSIAAAGVALILSARTMSHTVAWADHTISVQTRLTEIRRIITDLSIDLRDVASGERPEAAADIAAARARLPAPSSARTRAGAAHAR